MKTILSIIFLVFLLIWLSLFGYFNKNEKSSEYINFISKQLDSDISSSLILLNNHQLNKRQKEIFQTNRFQTKDTIYNHIKITYPNKKTFIQKIIIMYTNKDMLIIDYSPYFSQEHGFQIINKKIDYFSTQDEKPKKIENILLSMTNSTIKLPIEKNNLDTQIVLDIKSEYDRKKAKTFFIFNDNSFNFKYCQNILNKKPKQSSFCHSY